MDGRAIEDLALIRRVMEDSRREVVDRGIHFLIWGFVLVVGQLATHLHLTTGTGPDPVWVWIGVMAAGWAASMTIGWREDRKARVRTLGARILAVTWISVSVSLMLVAVAGMFGGLVDGQALPGVQSAIIGAPVLLTGFLVGERWLMGVGIGWWAGAAVMLFVPGTYPLLLLAAMSLLLLALPGAVLYLRARRGAGAPA